MSNSESLKKFKSTFQKISWARQTLDLPESATMEEIKKNFRRLIAKWHPDKCRKKKEKCHEMTEAILLANKIICDYCTQYKFSFSKEEINKYISKEEWWFNKFGADPIWGKSDFKKNGDTL